MKMLSGSAHGEGKERKFETFLDQVKCPIFLRPFLISLVRD